LFSFGGRPIDELREEIIKLLDQINDTDTLRFLLNFIKGYLKKKPG
jgi:hypothetical protein